MLRVFLLLSVVCAGFCFQPIRPPGYVPEEPTHSPRGLPSSYAYSRIGRSAYEEESPVELTRVARGFKPHFDVTIPPYKPRQPKIKLPYIRYK